MSVFYTGKMLANTFSGLIAAGIFAGLDQKHGIAGLKWYVTLDSLHMPTADERIRRLFIIQGSVTVAVAFVGIFLLPDTPLKTRWPNAEERQLAHDRIARDTTGLNRSTSSRKGFMEAITDSRSWLFCLMLILHLCQWI